MLINNNTKNESMVTTWVYFIFLIDTETYCNQIVTDSIRHRSSQCWISLYLAFSFLETQHVVMNATLL